MKGAVFMYKSNLDPADIEEMFSQPFSPPVYGMCWLLPDRKPDCANCKRVCPVNAGYATYESMFEVTKERDIT